MPVTPELFEPDSEIAAVFDGQGVNGPGMGRQIYDRFGVARETFRAASDKVGFDIARVCFGDLSFLQSDTRIAQPSSATVNLAEYGAWCEVNEREADLVTGMSKGLYSCLSASGMVKANSRAEADAKVVGLVFDRANITYENDQQNPGGMVAVLGRWRHEIAELLPENIKFGVSRGDKHFILTGPKQAIVNFLKEHKTYFGERRSRQLDIDQAAHHPLQVGTQEPLRKVLLEVVTENPRIRFLGNGPEPSPLSTKEAVIGHLLDQMVEEALWFGTIRKMAELGITHAVEFGPDTKRGLLKDISKGSDIVTVRFPTYTETA